MIAQSLPVARAVVRPCFAVVLAAALAFGVVAGDRVARAQTTAFAVGETVVVNTGSLTLRSDAALSADAIATLVDGTWATVVDGPVDADGYAWYGLDVDGTTGWAAGDYLADAESGSELPAGTVVSVTADELNLREASGLEAGVVSVLANGAVATVLAGPESVDGYDWYQLDAGGVVGWTVRDFLAFAPGGGSFIAGDAVIVNTDGLNLRAEAGSTADLVAALPGGTAATILAGPVAADDGYTWYQAETELGTGWLVGDYLWLV